jgi:site-specific DNA-adenine methylase
MVNSPLIWVGGKSRAMSHVLDALPTVNAWLSLSWEAVASS